jgi:hypothetical protein
VGDTDIHDEFHRSVSDMALLILGVVEREGQ